MNAKIRSAAVFLFTFAGLAQACINDSQTAIDKGAMPTLETEIRNAPIPKPNVKSLTAQILRLKAAPKVNDAAWWNELAGTYLRLNQPNEAVKILEPLTRRFPNDYGIHANLGTAYHLLGRYADAEKEIRRDLDINPEGHFGREKYHLALLQYLGRDRNYQARHVYVEEFTEPFLDGRVKFMKAVPQTWVLAQHENTLADADRQKLEQKLQLLLHKKSALKLTPENRSDLLDLANSDKAPAYLAKWDLGQDPKLDDGVIYMAVFNPREPACKVMLGMVALKNGDLHLAKAAFEQAIQLGSPQAPFLRAEIRRINQESWHFVNVQNGLVGLAGLVVLFILYRVWLGSRRKVEST